MMARLQVNISDEMMSRIDMYASKLGVTRSAFCAVVLGQGLAGYDATFGMVSDVQTQMTNKLLERVEK